MNIKGLYLTVAELREVLKDAKLVRKDINAILRIVEEENLSPDTPLHVTESQIYFLPAPEGAALTHEWGD